MNKHNAIYSINSNIKRIEELDDDTFVCYDENGNSVDTPSIEAIDAKKTEMITDAENEKQTKIDAQASGNQKLLDLGLTQAEATALTGYTPPVAE